ncbi:MAG: hypothetical protein Q4B60_00590 [Erysipelotrichaceae bacterium]|nr:hypothetical protein [Erysipelotrichaceae bacterium]
MTIRENLIDRIIELSNIQAISSREERMIDYLKEVFKDTSYTVTVDNIGNITAYHPKQEEGKQKVLVFAHIDEIGIIVRKISEDGFIYIERMGGVTTTIMPGQHFEFDTPNGFVDGVIGVQGHHFMDQENKFSVYPIKKMYVDVCASSKQEVLDMGIDVGTMATFSQKCELINNKYLRGKAIDNRAAVGILVELALEMEKKNPDVNLIFAFPVQEEFNIRGLMPVIRKVKPDIAIGLDITCSCDTPDMDYNDVKMDGGPAIAYMNFHGGGTLAGVLPNMKLVKDFEETAKEMNIPLQKEISPGVITENAFGLFENEEGIKVGNLSIPTRYTHTPFEIASVGDIVQLYNLMHEMLLKRLKG